jgi:hypothetical protein
MYQQGGPFLAMRGPFITASGGGASVASATAEVTGATEITFNVEVSPASYAGIEWGVSPDYTWSAFSAFLGNDHEIIIDSADGVVAGTTYAWRSYATSDPLDAPGNRVYGVSGSVVVPSGDPYFADVSLLVINDNQADGTTTFDDQSSNNFTVTTVGNAQYDTAQAPTGMTSSMLSDGTGDWLTVPNNADFNFAAGDFTVEGFVRFNAVTGFKGIISGTTADVNTELWLLIAANGTALEWYASSADGSWNIASAQSFGTVATGQWYHFALVRNGNTWTPYLNGVAGGGVVTSSSTLSFGIGVIFIGTDRASSSRSHNGWLCSTRITKGVARYTANFTPPTLPMLTS